MCATVLVNFYCQITMTRHFRAKPPPQYRGAMRFAPRQSIWADKIIYALLLVYMAGYRIFVALYGLLALPSRGSVLKIVPALVWWIGVSFGVRVIIIIIIKVLFQTQYMVHSQTQY